jgi:IS30 family transposase
MLKYMERSTIYSLKQKGWSNLAIAEVIGCHRDTVGRILREPVITAQALANDLVAAPNRSAVTALL